jgi:predicted ATPase
MCNTLAAREAATIVIIDEPEISLNVKWQRRLVQALLDCVTGSNAQLIFATHSIELLAKHKSQVVKLEDLAHREKPSHIKDKTYESRREADNRGVGSEV